MSRDVFPAVKNYDIDRFYFLAGQSYVIISLTCC